MGLNSFSCRCWFSSGSAGPDLQITDPVFIFRDLEDKLILSFTIGAGLP